MGHLVIIIPGVSKIIDSVVFDEEIFLIVMYKENQDRFHDMIYIFIHFFIENLIYIHKFTKYVN